MKISFDMSSLSSVSSAATSSSSSSLSSVRETIITYARSILPSMPASFYDFVPFTLAGIMALLFTALLVLLVEDSEESYPHSGRNGSATSKPGRLQSSRIVGLAEREKDAESGDDEWDAAPWDPRADLDSTSRRNLKQSQNWMSIQNEKIAKSNGYRTTNKRLLASPPSSASPQSPAFNTPMLSMAKLIMHRHDQSSKRARSSKALPPSPPPATSTSFGTMQYTLKSATLRADKLALVAFPGSESSTESQSQAPTEQATSPHRSHPDTEMGMIDEAKKRPSTRHARSRSTVLASIPNLNLPTLSDIPSLVPALQLLQSKSVSERTVRRSPSSILEEGGSSDHPTRPRRESLSTARAESDRLEALSKSEGRSIAIGDLEEGSHR